MQRHDSAAPQRQPEDHLIPLHEAAPTPADPLARISRPDSLRGDRPGRRSARPGHRPARGVSGAPLPRPRPRRRQRGQGMMEMALALPIFLLLVFGLIDLARVAYTQAEITALSRTVAQKMQSPANALSDCSLLTGLSGVGGVLVTPDPHSILGDPSPATPSAAGPSDPPAGQGYLYLYPALAADPLNPTECGTPGAARFHGEVTVLVRYRFQPSTPFLSTFLSGVTLEAQTTVETGY